MKKTLLNKIKQFTKELKKYSSDRQPISYRVVEIDTEDGLTTVTVQVIGKNVIFKSTPEEILADDAMTAQFSTTDIRNLTYLGYKDINQPQYKILAKQQDDQNETVFAVHKRGEKNVTIKTATEISNDPDMLHAIDQDDAHMVGYTAATEKKLSENAAKQQAKKAIQEKNKIENEQKD